jgi:hypothetical protein
MSRKFTSLITERAVRSSFIPQLCLTLFLAALFAGAAFAQGMGPSVMIYTYGKQGTDAEAMSHVISQQIGSEMLDKFPCIDQYDDNSIAALLGWERARQVLGQEPNAELMQSVAGAVGARYVVSVSATTLPNGQTYATVTVMDGQTGQSIAKEDTPPANADDAVDAADALAKKVVQDLANLFKDKCEPHWTGTVTYSFKYQKSDKKTTEGVPGAMERDVIVNTSSSDSMEDAVEAFLQPMSQGTEGSKIMSQVVHRYTRHYELTETRSGKVLCRPKNGNSYLSTSSGNSSELVDERGQNRKVLPVYIYVEKSGRYEISAQYPALTTARSEQRSGNNSGCGSSKPYSESNSGTGSAESDSYTQAGSFKARGQVDPQNPDVLSGKQVTGDLENGQYTLEWNLRRVNPNQKKALK